MLNTLEIILGVVILVLALGLVVCIAAQRSKKSGLGGVVGGGATDSFYGKNKSRTKENVLKKLTIVFGILLGVLALVLYAYHGTVNNGGSSTSSTPSSPVSTSSNESATSAEESGASSAVSNAEESGAASSEESADASSEESETVSAEESETVSAQ